MPIYTPPKIDYLLVKVAARCNIDCSYCYWFQDKSVYAKPKLMEERVYRKLIDRIVEQVDAYELPKFSLLFHGGEPTLWGINRISDFVTRLNEKAPCPVRYSMTTNGVLIDETWARTLNRLKVAVTVSIDGPAAVHDMRRRTFQGGGTFHSSVAGFQTLQRHGVRTSALAVCDPLSDPEEVCRFFVDDLRTPSFDVLVPEANHDRPPQFSIARYFTRLFDLWLDHYGMQGVSMRLPKALAIAALGGDTHLESIGFGAQQTSTVLTDGSLEPLDVLRYAGTQHTRTSLNIFDNRLQELVDEQLWREVFNNSLNLPSACRPCPYRDACGGGYAPHRFSSQRRYDNPSVYCEDYKAIFAHVFSRLNSSIRVQIDGAEHEAQELARGLAGAGVQE